MRVEANTAEEAIRLQQIQAASAAKVGTPAVRDETIIPTGSLFDAVGVKLDLSSKARNYLEKGRSISSQIQQQAVRQGVIESTPAPISTPVVTAAYSTPAVSGTQLNLAA